jgi:hypothetical protein
MPGLQAMIPSSSLCGPLHGLLSLLHNMAPGFQDGAHHGGSAWHFYIAFLEVTVSLSPIDWKLQKPIQFQWGGDNRYHLLMGEWHHCKRTLDPKRLFPLSKIQLTKPCSNLNSDQPDNLTAPRIKIISSFWFNNKGSYSLLFTQQSRFVLWGSKSSWKKKV